MGGKGDEHEQERAALLSAGEEESISEEGEEGNEKVALGRRCLTDLCGLSSGEGTSAISVR